MKSEPSTSGQFTGRHMLAIMLVFFGVIIVVNVSMATLANTSWTGFVVKNSYIAGLEFNRRAEDGRRQAALGWEPELAIAEGRLRYALSDSAGAPVLLSGGTASFRRPVSDREDIAVALFTVSGGALQGPAALADGVWIVEIVAEAGLETPYRDTRRLFVREGVAR